jgi:hypothetical protein
MNREFKYWMITMYLCITIVALFVFIVTYPESKRQNNNIIKEEPIKDSLISQYHLQKIYGWKEITLWTESKAAFEKSCGQKLHWINYPMEFVWHPECVNPIGGGEEWPHIKACFYYRFPTGMPEIPELIAKESQNKNLVIIGSLFSYGQKFSGSVYWYE